MIDLHCHILPGIDDGPGSLDEATRMCRLAARDGITGLVATPHFLDGARGSASRRAGRDARIAALRAALDAAGIDLALHPGAEIHLVPDLRVLLRAEPTLTLNGSRHVLIELPQVFPPTVKDMLFELRLLGYRPILAHPERHDCVQRDPDLLLPLAAAGIMTQITAQSLLGDFGEACRRCAETLVQARTAHIVASDAHGANHRPPLLSAARTRLAALVGAAEARAMTETRPWAVLRDESVDLPDPRPSRAPSKPRRPAQPGWLARLGAML